MKTLSSGYDEEHVAEHAARRHAEARVLAKYAIRKYFGVSLAELELLDAGTIFELAAGIPAEKE